MSKYGTKIVDGVKYNLKKDQSIGSKYNHPSKKSSKDLKEPKSRVQKDGAITTPEPRRPRVHRGAGRALDLSEGIKADIKAKDCVSRWVADENSRVQLFLDDWWDIYLDANGNQIRVLAGTGKNGQGVDFVLMIQKNEYYAETLDLKKKKVAGTLESQQVLNGGNAPEYVPDGQGSVIEQVAGD